MYQILKSQLRANEMRALLCLFGYNHSITGYADLRLLIYHSGEYRIRFEETVFLSEDHRALSNQILAAERNRASAQGLHIAHLTHSEPNQRGALILLRDIAHLRAGLATVVDDSAFAFSN